MLLLLLIMIMLIGKFIFVRQANQSQGGLNIYKWPLYLSGHFLYLCRFLSAGERYMFELGKLGK